MFSFDFDALDEELDSAEPHQAEVASPWIIDGPEASRPVKDTAPNLSQGMFAKVSDQHYRRIQELKELEEQKHLDDDPLTWNGNETRISCWSMLDDGPAPGGTPEAGDKAPDDTGFDSEITLSDDSDASIYGLRRTIHEIEKRR